MKILSFFAHLKQHNLGPNETYLCKQYNCNREFQNVRSFRRHLIAQHLPPPCSTQSILNQELPTINCAHSEEIANCDYQETVSCISLDCNDSSKHRVIHENLLETTSSKLQKSAATLAISLYSDPGVNRKTAHKVLENVHLYITEVIGDIFKDVMPKINELDQSEIDNINKLISNPFVDLSREYQIIKYFTDINCYIAPEKFIINEGVAENTVNSTVMLAPKSSLGAKVPLRLVMQKILELPNFLKFILDSLQSNEIDNPNFTHSLIWRKKNC